MKKLLVSLVVLAAVGGSAFAYYTTYGRDGQTASVSTAPVTRGDIADSVSATGTLQAVTTVQVGTQVSGTIQELYADFNSLVRKGQVLARLDPSLFQTQIEQAQANFIRSEADLERLKVMLDDARTKLVRANELWAQQLIPQTELDTAEVNVRSIEAQIRSSQAQVTGSGSGSSIGHPATSGTTRTASAASFVQCPGPIPRAPFEHDPEGRSRCAATWTASAPDPAAGMTIVRGHDRVTLPRHASPAPAP